MSKHTQKPYKKSLFVFRRDLRLDDNSGLSTALENSETVMLCFIFDPRQVSEANEYRSHNALQFMIESLHDLEQQCAQVKAKLFYFYGQADEVIQKIIATEQLNALFCNRDYTPFSIQRDKLIATICNQHSVAFHQYDDVLLIKPEDVLTKKGTPYTKFTAFYTAASQLPVQKSVPLPDGLFQNTAMTDCKSLKDMQDILISSANNQLHVRGGTSHALSCLTELNAQKQYLKIHDFPAQHTSNLSAYLKFGSISIRHTYYAIRTQLSPAHPLIRQLYWRDFFSYVAFHNPRVFGHAFQKKYDSITWSSNNNHFKAWCAGTTGFPIVDAGMRQLNTTGYMHNRVRMIVASFLTKDLHINWLDGERYFARQLVDYDPAINNGNWQWCASTGCDAQPYFRIFNPWLQQKKFDPECIYIKRWIPELQGLDPKVIHTWYNPKSPYVKDYPRPMVDHTHESRLAKQHFAAV
jgi:deoxyribodipyrimidine photo-lyase